MPEGVSSSSDRGACTQWVCKKCGFRNRPGNTTCGGVGALGCKAPRDESETAAQEEEAELEALPPYVCPSCDYENDPLAHICVECGALRRFKGILKSCGSDYGFIDCKETFKRFKRDVWIGRPVMNAAFGKAIVTSGAQVSFKISINSDGNPNAKEMEIIKFVDGSEDGEARTFHGHVKYISVEKGYGFIECPEANELYNSDVHVDLLTLEGCCLGQKVSFQVRLGAIGGRPQGVNVSPEGPPPEVMPTTHKGEAAQLLRHTWEPSDLDVLNKTMSSMEPGPKGWLDSSGSRRVLLLGEGDLTFAEACAKLHPGSCLDATVYLEAAQWHERFPRDAARIAFLQERGHRVRFGVDAMTESCAGCCAAYFNFPSISVTEEQRLFPDNAAATFPGESSSSTDTCTTTVAMTRTELLQKLQKLAIAKPNEFGQCAPEDLPWIVEKKRDALWNNAQIIPKEEAKDGLTPSGELAAKFLENARATADPDTFLILGLWGRCDGGADPRLYGQDSHALVANGIKASELSGNRLKDSIKVGFEREGVHADYSFYEPYEKEGYMFRTNLELGAAGFANKEWHLKGCFVTRVSID